MELPTIGQRLRAWRTASGLSQYEASQVFGCTPDAYSKWERDEVAPRGRDFKYARAVERVLQRYENQATVEER
uniref:Putative DNA binding, helix-turn-helix domain containing protein n=1 Tax=viral metagenome TaxID=1070528 RepID=A0A6M3IMG0_9ZZZZ